GATTGGAVAASTAGSDGATPQDSDYLTHGFPAFDHTQDVNILAAPGIGTEAVIDGGTSYCPDRSDCVFIGGLPPTDTGPADATSFIATLTNKSSYGAVYFPWIKIIDPTGQSPSPILAPPSGFLAGIYARIDGKRGVFKAPAGTEANVAGSVGLAGL